MCIEIHHDKYNANEQSTTTKVSGHDEQTSSTKTPRRTLDLVDDDTDSENGDHDISIKKPRTSGN